MNLPQVFVEDFFEKKSSTRQVYATNSFPLKNVFEAENHSRAILGVH